MNTQVAEFLKATPNSNKTAITTATGIKGIQLFNLVKKMLSTGQIIMEGEGSEATYSVNENYSEEKVPENKAFEIGFELGEEPDDNSGKTEEGVASPEENKGGKLKPKEETKEPTTRDNSKYEFNGVANLGKGPLVRAIVAKYVEDNPDVTFKQLKDIFPDTLMKRFGVFANETEAKKLSGNKPRYFMKEEQMIKIKGQKEQIAICNQWTATLIEPFIAVAKNLGYKIK